MDLVAYRVAAWDTPLWALPNRRANRYNHADEGPTQYLSLHPQGPWAEVLRHEEVRDDAEAENLRPPLWALRFRDAEPLEIGFDSCERYGLAPEDLVADDHAACRALATAFRRDPSGPRTLIVPSAALPGTRNLVILDARVAAPYDATPLDDVDVPLALAAEGGRSPRGLVEAVHHFGSRAPHAGLAAWRAGEDLVLTEPPTEHLAA